MRAWTCHGRNQRELVERLRQANIVQSPAVQSVLLQVDRQHYVTAPSTGSPYQDAPQGIGKGQTISAPHMHAHVLEEILPYILQQPQNNNNNGGTTADATSTTSSTSQQQEQRPIRILDVGCGSGYLTACLGRWFRAHPDSLHAQLKDQQGQASSSDISSPTSSSSPLWTTHSILQRPGLVYGIDIHVDLVEFARTNIAKADGDLLASKTVQLQPGNGWYGLPEHGPYDAIHVGAAAATFPQQLATQLRVGGVLIVPIGPTGGAQSLYKVERIQELSSSSSSSPENTSSNNFEPNDYRVTELLGVRYVPLVQGP